MQASHQVPNDSMHCSSSPSFPSCPRLPHASCEVMPEDSLQGLRALFLSHQSPILIQTPCPSRNLTERTRARAPSAFNWSHRRLGAQCPIAHNVQSMCGLLLNHSGLWLLPTIQADSQSGQEEVLGMRQKAQQ